MKILNGFTLAEVLITLGIVGVVAAMTMPVLINDIQGRQLQSAVKKSYSTISQALEMYYAENGERYVPTEQGVLKLVLIKHIKNIRDCGFGQDGDTKACVKANEFPNIYKTYNGKISVIRYSFDDGQFVMNDGALVMIEDVSGIANKYISIDVNGYRKRPNRLGQDVFMFQIMPDGKLLPMGMEGTAYNKNTYCSLTSESGMNGAGCTVKALSEKDFFKNLPK